MTGQRAIRWSKRFPEGAARRPASRPTPAELASGSVGSNIRPTLYGARYTAALANRWSAEPSRTVTIAGKYCESGDVLIDQADLPPLAPGDLLALPAAGAYCLAMASNYNLSTRPAVVLVQDGDARLIRRRETYADLLATEVLP